MHEWSQAFGDIPIYVHEADRRVGPGPDRRVLGRRRAARSCPAGPWSTPAVHFAGGTVLHWAAAPTGAARSCTGDIVMVVMDRRYVSFMYSYPNLIPEHPDDRPPGRSP